MLRHISPISGIASYADQYIATAGYDNRVIMWDAQTKLPVAVGNHDHLANQCEFSNCGKYLVTCSSDHTARLWRVPEMKLIAVLSDHQDDVESTAIHANESLIATASRDNKVRLFDFNGRLLKVMQGHEADVISVQWQGDSKILISSSDDGTIRVWDIETGNQINQLNDSGIETDALAISKDGIVFAGDDSGQIHVISQTSKLTLSAHKAGIKKLVYHDNDKQLISVAYDRKACLWNIVSNDKFELAAEFNLPNIIWPRSCAFLGDTKIAFATFGDSYAIYDFKIGNWELDHINDTTGINAVLSERCNVWTVGDAGLFKLNQKVVQRLPSLCNFIVACGKTILTGGQSGEIFDALTARIIYTHRSPLNCATSFERNGQYYMIIGSYTGEGILLKQDAGNIVYVGMISLHNNAIKGLAINNDILFSVCATGAVAWHDLNNHKQLKNIKGAHHKIANGCVAIDEGNFASISRDLVLRIWDGRNLALKSEILSPHTHSVKCIATDINCRYLATGSYNGMIQIYDRNTSGWQNHRKTSAGISSICFDEINYRFLAASYDGNIYSIEGLKI